MKALALLTALLLHATGLWSHTPETTRTSLTNTAVSNAKTATVAPIAPTLAYKPLPIQAGTEAATVDASSAYALDLTTGTTLYAKDAHHRRPIASVTKIVTSLVILSRHQPDERAKIPTLPAYNLADETLGLRSGETYTIGDLIEATLINSGNDAADALALYDAGTINHFAARMNAKMAEWGITDTHWNNPTGLVDNGNYATAAALGKIAGLALTNSFIRQTIIRPDAAITSTTGRTINLTSTNKLLATGKFYGIKTGYTPAAGECFVGLTRVNGHEVVTVVLGADDRFGATQQLTNWISRNWQWL